MISYKRTKIVEFGQHYKRVLLTCFRCACAETAV